MILFLASFSFFAPSIKWLIFSILFGKKPHNNNRRNSSLSFFISSRLRYAKPLKIPSDSFFLFLFFLKFTISLTLLRATLKEFPTWKRMVILKMLLETKSILRGNASALTLHPFLPLNLPFSYFTQMPQTRKVHFDAQKKNVLSISGSNPLNVISSWIKKKILSTKFVPHRSHSSRMPI